MFDIVQQMNVLGLVIVIAIVVILFVAIVNIVRMKQQYSDLKQDLLNRRKSKEFKEGTVVDRIVRDYRLTAEDQYGDVNTQAIIERNIHKSMPKAIFGERFSKNAISLMIILGLLGTFYGLTLSIGDIVKVLGTSNSVEVVDSLQGVVGGLMSSIQGMSVAFVTSLVGIVASIILTITQMFANVTTMREDFMVDMEEYLDNVISLEYIKTESREYVEYVKLATRGMQDASDALLNSVKAFEKALDRFSDNTRDFTEFNHHLRTNIDRMNVSFSDMSEQFKLTADKLEKHDAQ